mmetsp:Transcript_31874/g.83918  ORF Transcript_31874/g.83918 Transcript_31874/m.83918 type:complete len:221 (+) Transcript_31874:684-1346(+)
MLCNIRRLAAGMRPSKIAFTSSRVRSSGEEPCQLRMAITIQQQKSTTGPSCQTGVPPGRFCTRSPVGRGMPESLPATPSKHHTLKPRAAVANKPIGGIGKAAHTWSTSRLRVRIANHTSTMDSAQTRQSVYCFASPSAPRTRFPGLHQALLRDGRHTVCSSSHKTILSSRKKTNVAAANRAIGMFTSVSVHQRSSKMGVFCKIVPPLYLKSKVIKDVVIM